MKSGQLMRQVVNKINEVDFNNLDERQHFGEYLRAASQRSAIGRQCGRILYAARRHRLHGRPNRPASRRNPVRSRLRHGRLSHLRHPPHGEELRQDARSSAKRCRARLRAVEKKQLPHMLCVTNMLLHGIEDPSFVRHDNTLARPLISWGKDERVDIVLTNPPFGGREEDGIENNFPTFRTKETADLFLALIVRLLKTGRARRRGAARRHAVRRGRQDAAQGTSDGGVQPPHHRSPAQFRVQALCLDRHQPAVLREGGADQGDLVLRAPRARGPESLLDDQADPAGAFSGLHRLVGRQGPEGPRGDAAGVAVTAEEVKARGYNLDIKNPHAVADDHGDPETLLADLHAPRPRRRACATS